MSATFDACLRSWPWDPWLLGGLALTGGIYWHGWHFLRRRDTIRWHVGKLVAFLCGLSAIFLALASPIEPFSYFFLQVHMLQHLLLLMAVPPLLWLGAPMFPLLRGLPKPIRVHWIAPLLRSPIGRDVFTRLTHPLPALIVFVAATWFWHLPYFYDLALRSNGWHYVQHASFLFSALVFWYPVVRPYPSRPGWSTWWLLPYLFLADVQNTVLSALLTFSDRVLYAHYADAPRLANISALEDQAAAGVLMWVPGSFAFLVPLFWIAIRLLYRPAPAPRRISLALVSAAPAASGLDLLHATLVGRFLRWRYARYFLQVPLLLLAGVIALDGFTGPDIGAMNLAGVLPWIHWRGLVVLGLLALGNIFCMACPFTLPHTIARRWLPVGFAWPRWLRNKWLAVGLVIGFLWAYEAFSLWDSPWLTAWIILAYFAAAFSVDSVFRGGSFCKYVCPIGQFNFVQSLMSPFEIKVRDAMVCASCETKDCIRGNADAPGCGLRLYQPHKSSNMDCTFCLDCVHACPHDNIGILAASPGAELLHDPSRSGIGRFSQRRDLAALIVVLVFGAFVNAALMTGPVVDWQERVMARIGVQSSLAATTVGCLLGLIAAPLLLMSGAAGLSRWWGRLTPNVSAIAIRFVYALIPLGFGMWLTHFCFHFFTSYASVLPTTQRFVADWAGMFLGSPAWSNACCVPAALWLLRLEIVFLDVGLLLSLYTGYRIARSQTTRLSQAVATFAPWAILMIFLFAVGIWIVFQPMQMRGTM